MSVAVMESTNVSASLLIACAVAGLLAAALLAWSITGRVLQPVHDVTDAARRPVVAGLPGDLSVQVNLFSRDEAAVEAGRPVEPDVLVRAGPPAHLHVQHERPHLAVLRPVQAQARRRCRPGYDSRP